MHHLRILGNAGIIEARKVGKFAVYNIVSAAAIAALQNVHTRELAGVGA
jgi:DNA-binding transcriptional ArsR family regulator